MLSKEYKIKRIDFPQDFHKAVSYYSPSLFLHVYKQKDLHNNSKFSFVVSKKVSKYAVQRVFLKRIGYNAVEKIIHEVQPGFFCVFHFKKAAATYTRVELEDEIMKLLRCAQIII